MLNKLSSFGSENMILSLNLWYYFKPNATAAVEIYFLTAVTACMTAVTAHSAGVATGLWNKDFILLSYSSCFQAAVTGTGIVGWQLKNAHWFSTMPVKFLAC